MTSSAADYVLSARKTLDMSQSAFAAVLGVTARTVRNWERGHCPVSGPVALAIAALLREKEGA